MGFSIMHPLRGIATKRTLAAQHRAEQPVGVATHGFADLSNNRVQARPVRPAHPPSAPQPAPVGARGLRA